MGLKAVQVWDDGRLLWDHCLLVDQICIILSFFSLSLNTGTSSNLYANVFAKQHSAWQFTSFITHYMVEFITDKLWCPQAYINYLLLLYLLYKGTADVNNMLL